MGAIPARQDNKEKDQQPEEGRRNRRDSNAPNHCTLSEPGVASPKTRPITKTPPSPCGKSALPAKFSIWTNQLDDAIGNT
jgi:hypothetical protein